MQAPLTPLELRSRRRDEQTRVRRAYNELNVAIDLWKKAHDAGLTAATAASNAYLSQWYLPATPLGVLAQVPGIRGAAVAKLHSRALRQLTAVRAAVGDCRSAAEQLRATADGLAMSEGGTAVGQAVFAALSLPLIAGEVANLAAAHEAELAVKAEVLACLESTIEDEAPPSKGGFAEQDRKRRDHMQVVLAAWMLQCKLDKALVDGTLQALAAEMKGF